MSRFPGDFVTLAEFSILSAGGLFFVVLVLLVVSSCNSIGLRISESALAIAQYTAPGKSKPLLLIAARNAGGSTWADLLRRATIYKRIAICNAEESQFRQSNQCLERALVTLQSGSCSPAPVLAKIVQEEVVSIKCMQAANYRLGNDFATAEKAYEDCLRELVRLNRNYPSACVLEYVRECIAGLEMCAVRLNQPQNSTRLSRENTLLKTDTGTFKWFAEKKMNLPTSDLALDGIVMHQLIKGHAELERGDLESASRTYTEIDRETPLLSSSSTVLVQALRDCASFAGRVHDTRKRIVLLNRILALAADHPAQPNNASNVASDLIELLSCYCSTGQIQEFVKTFIANSDCLSLKKSYLHREMICVMVAQFENSCLMDETKRADLQRLLSAVHAAFDQQHNSEHTKLLLKQFSLAEKILDQSPEVAKSQFYSLLSNRAIVNSADQYHLGALVVALASQLRVAHKMEDARAVLVSGLQMHLRPAQEFEILKERLALETWTNDPSKYGPARMALVGFAKKHEAELDRGALFQVMADNASAQIRSGDIESGVTRGHELVVKLFNFDTSTRALVLNDYIASACVDWVRRHPKDDRLDSLMSQCRTAWKQGRSAQSIDLAEFLYLYSRYEFQRGKRKNAISDSGECLAVLRLRATEFQPWRLAAHIWNRRLQSGDRDFLKDSAESVNQPAQTLRDELLYVQALRDERASCGDEECVRLCDEALHATHP